MDLSRSGIPLSIRSLFPWGREHLCYPRYNPAITGECCPKANPGPRVIIHRDYRAHRIPLEIFFAVTEGAQSLFFFISFEFDRVRILDLSFIPFCFRLSSILDLVRIYICFKDGGVSEISTRFCKLCTLFIVNWFLRKYFTSICIHIFR